MTIGSALKTFVMPRAAVAAVVRPWFRLLRFGFDLRLRWVDRYEDRDRIIAFYAPIALVSLLPIWLVFVTIGFMAMFWPTGIASGFEDFVISDSSLLTLGFARGQTMTHDILVYITRTEFDETCAQLAAQGVPLKTNREQAWLDFAGWRVNYDKVLLDLYLLTMAPLAPWSSDRSSLERPLPLFAKPRR